MTERVATVDELFGRGRRDDRTVLVDGTGREFDAHWLCTTTWKAGNFLRHVGVHEGTTVGVVGGGPLALLACFGTTLLGGKTRFEPPTDLADADDLQALVAPIDDIETGRYDLPRGTGKLGYGDEPTTPGVSHFDAGLWSENPSFPPQTLDPETGLLTDGKRTDTHEDVIETAADVIDDYGLETGTRVVVRAPLSAPETVAAGVVAPLLAEGVIVLAGTEAEPDDEPTGDRGAYAVSNDPVPEPNRIAPDAVSL
ncbi:hypothetical protein [Natrialba asiatica]|uniref:Acetyl-CoA synthetase n=1 Tax=Natrialba asiatica (strain ATCC 700177 / DSM 12278 / JCM 9576 / FERM P-10747 / NBRC 102637 / 172P1) TaxID=29540 RepID=M0AYY5_NATA1|nr:hypothetical protein [Natrialba asiatica]ELZ02634.1 hypothetical protein C481_08201 [Natrialba asiatica DSM 12278]